MQARIKNMHTILGDAWGPMVTLGKTLASSPVPKKTRELVLHSHRADQRLRRVPRRTRREEQQETPQRLGAVAVWQEAPFFSEPERAALGLAEAITRLADQTERVPDAVWNEAERYYDEQASARVARVRGCGRKPLQPPQRGDAPSRRHAAMVINPFLAPIEHPSSFLLKVAFFFVRRQPHEHRPQHRVGWPV